MLDQIVFDKNIFRAYSLIQKKLYSHFTQDIMKTYPKTARKMSANVFFFFFFKTDILVISCI